MLLNKFYQLCATLTLCSIIVSRLLAAEPTAVAGICGTEFGRNAD